MSTLNDKMLETIRIFDILVYGFSNNNILTYKIKHGIVFCDTNASKFYKIENLKVEEVKFKEFNSLIAASAPFTTKLNEKLVVINTIKKFNLQERYPEFII